MSFLILSKSVRRFSLAEILGTIVASLVSRRAVVALAVSSCVFNLKKYWVWVKKIERSFGFKKVLGSKVVLGLKNFEYSLVNS